MALLLPLLAAAELGAQPAPVPAPKPAVAAPAPATLAPPATAAPAAAPTVSAPTMTDGTPAGAAADKKPRKFWIDGKLRELKKGEVRPYKAPTLLPEPDPQPSSVRVFELAHPKEPEVQVLARPYYGAPMIGTASTGTRTAVRGEVMVQTSRWFCPSRKWLALAPFGWVCADHGKPTEQPAPSRS